MPSPASVLVLMTSPLGNLAHALSVVASFKVQRPDLEVTWVVREVFEPLVAACDAVDRTIVFQRKGGLKGAWRLARELRGRRYDCVLDFEGHARTGLMARLARAGCRVGRPDAREGASIFYDTIVPKPPEGRGHFVDRLLEFGCALGIPPRFREGALRFDRALSGLASPIANLEGRRLVCLFPRRFREARSWPEYDELARALLASREDLMVAFLGVGTGKGGPGLGAAWSGRFLDLQGQLSWGEVVAVLLQADLVVSGDGGPAQLAGALGRKNLTLFSFVDPERRGSYPLEWSGNAVLKGRGGQVTTLRVEEALEAALRLLEQGQ